MKNENVMPDWVLKYKKKGYSIRKKGNSYVLFKVSSKRFEGKKYPVTTSKYICVIKETGLIQSKALTIQEVKQLKNEQSTYIEYGYTNLIYKLCYRELVRSIYGYTAKYSNPLIFLAIIQYVMGSDSLIAISSTYLGVSHYKDIRQNPVEENTFRQLRLNQWVKQTVRWMPMEKWEKCKADFNAEDLKGRVCYGALTFLLQQILRLLF